MVSGCHTSTGKCVGEPAGSSPQHGVGPWAWLSWFPPLKVLPWEGSSALSRGIFLTVVLGVGGRDGYT